MIPKFVLVALVLGVKCKCVDRPSARVGVMHRPSSPDGRRIRRGRARSQMLEAVIAHRRRLLAVPPVPLGLEFWGECARRQQSNAAAIRPTRLCVRESKVAVARLTEHRDE